MVFTIKSIFKSFFRYYNLAKYKQMYDLVKKVFNWELLKWQMFDKRSMQKLEFTFEKRDT